MKTKMMVALLATVLFTSSLAGCTGTPKEAATPDGNAAATSGEAGGKASKVTMTMWGDFTDSDVETTLVNKFNESREDIQIEFQPIPGDGYGDKLMANFAAGSGCDIFLIGEGDYRMYYSQGVTESLTPYIEKDQEFDLASFNEGLINSATFDSQLHYLPKDFNPIALFYNKDMFDKYEIAYPDTTWTWDDLEAAAKVMTNEADKEYGFYADAWAYATQVYLKSFGVEIGNEEATTATGYLNADETVALVTRYTDYILKDKISPSTTAAESFGGSTSMFQTGQVAMMISGGWNRSTLNKAGTNYGTAMVPIGKDDLRGEIICSASFAIYSKSKVKDAAWEVMKYISNKDAAQARYDAKSDLPSNQALLDQVKASDPASAGLIDIMEYATQTVRQKGDMGQYFDAPYQAAFEEILIANADPKAALDKAAAAIDKKIAEESK